MTPRAEIAVALASFTEEERKAFTTVTRRAVDDLLSQDRSVARAARQAAAEASS